MMSGDGWPYTEEQAVRYAASGLRVCELCGVVNHEGGHVHDRCRDEAIPACECSKCGRCGGTGTVHWYLGDEFNSQGYSECEICDGTGTCAEDCPLHADGYVIHETDCGCWIWEECSCD